MKQVIAFDDAVDLLDTDHKLVNQLFIDDAARCQEAAPPAAKREISLRSCQALTVHSQLEEEMFYPLVREAIDDKVLMDEALHEHAAAKQLIVLLDGMAATDPGYDARVKQLGTLIDQQVAEQREQIFLKARNAAIDLRGMVLPLLPLLPLLKRQQQLKKAATATAKKSA